MQNEMSPVELESGLSPKDLAKSVFHPVLERINASYLAARATYAFGDAIDKSSCLFIMQWSEDGQPCKVEVKIHKDKVTTLKIGGEPKQALIQGQAALAEMEQKVIQAISENRCSYTLVEDEEIW